MSFPLMLVFQVLMVITLLYYMLAQVPVSVIPMIGSNGIFALISGADCDKL